MWEMLTGNILNTTESLFFGMFGIEEWVIDRNFIVELVILLMICLYGLSWVLKFSAFVPRAAGAWSGDFIFFDCIEYVVRFIASLGLFTYAIFISQNIYTTILLIVEILLIMGRFIYLICMKRKNYLKQRERWLEVLKERKKARQNNPLIQRQMMQQKQIPQ